MWARILRKVHMRKRFAGPASALLLAAVCSPITLFPAPGEAPTPTTEQILSYHSDITVNPDSTLVVDETISVLGRGAQIRHGICRNFPTHYQDRFGNAYIIHFAVAFVERDGQPEDYHLEKMSNGLRVYMGRSRELVSSGEHSYDLTYTVNREVGFFSDHDELYWNVTGNGWKVPIDEASATVHLPKGIAIEAMLLDAYTGPQGSARNDYIASADKQSNADFHTTRPLGPHEGLTIVVRWPKGFVRPPTDDENFQYFLSDNRVTLLGCIGLIVALIYYTAAWFLVGRHPGAGVIMPRCEPPHRFSPGAIRYVNRMAFDQKAMVANLMDLAVKKQLNIQEDGSGVFTLTCLEAGPAASSAAVTAGWSVAAFFQTMADEQVLLDKLFAEGRTIRLERENHTLVGGAIEALHSKLRSSLEKAYFLRNSRYLIPGLLISFATILWCAFSIQGAQRFLAFFLTVWLLFWSLVCAGLAAEVVAAWRNALTDPHHKASARSQAVIISAFSIPFFIGELVGLGMLGWAASPAVALILILLVFINYLFHCLFKRPTHSGRVLLDQIEGFRLFLAAVENDRSKALITPELTPDLFEKFLPYAMALNVEKVWSEKFRSVLSQAAQDGSARYSPGWYSGPNWDPLNAAAFATAIGSSFSSAISSSSTAPRSSSRGGAGRSSGGGGGGS
jgi:uncharacterized membrane protein YgcG